MSRHRPELYLVDIIDAARAVQGFIAPVAGAEAFEQDDLVRSAVLNKLHIIAEAVNLLPADLRERHSEVPWRETSRVAGWGDLPIDRSGNRP